ncbi:MAG: hypothetical protein KZQ83_09320 [gamma proteobacterium symbiont of Taylorina sp.]|nr:hypothetical protein [gamma proteobacterium symbiont of Taylorina sp.]
MSARNIELKYKIKKRPQYNDKDKDKELTNDIQHWDKSRKIILLENFINSYGLERELKIYLQEAAEREISDN